MRGVYLRFHVLCLRAVVAVRLPVPSCLLPFLAGSPAFPRKTPKKNMHMVGRSGVFLLPEFSCFSFFIFRFSVFLFFLRMCVLVIFSYVIGWAIILLSNFFGFYSEVIRSLRDYSLTIFSFASGIVSDP